MSRCSICHTLIQAADETVPCPECAQHYHRSCWDDMGGCATYGCARAAQAEKAPLIEAVGAGWGDEKNCPACGKTIGSSLLVCGCGATFPHAEPISREEWRDWVRKQDRRAGTRKLLVVLFFISLLGLPAPVVGPIAGFIAYQRREALAGVDGTYLAIGYGSAALGVTYALVILFLALGL